MQRNKETTDFALYLMLSILVVFKMAALFLFFAFILSFYRIVLFCKSFKKIKPSARLYGICMHFVWMAYILIFMTLLCIGYSADKRKLNEI